MSKQIDERVVSMEFDNRNFERNVRTSMSTLDKLKAKLSFKGQADGLDKISSSVKKMNFNPMVHGIQTVQAQFSALEVMGVTALANITNQAVNAGKRIVNALTFEPVLTGFQEYETQINAIQTILANTQSKGTTLGDVNAALDELNTYADQTIYNFTEMTKNIGTFTAAGVDLDKSVQSIKGIANLAAVSGSNSQQASTAMYQLSQALAAGKVSLMDWNSVVNAGMGGEVFQNALIRTAQTMGTGVDEALKKYGTFRESLTEGAWLTADVLTETLAQLSGAYTEADLIAQGYTEEQAKQIVELANTAVSAATDVKTFTQLWDTMKESVQSGWTNTWEIIVGDFGEAKELLTEISETFGDMIGKSAESRNDLLYGALTSNWKKVTDGITEAGLSADDYQNKVSEVAKAQGVDVDAMISEYGSLESAFKNGAISSKVLKDALIAITGTADENKKKLEELTGKYKTTRDITDALTKAGYDLNDQQNIYSKINAGQAITLNDLTDAQLLSIGYTAEQIQAIRQYSTNLELANGSLDEFINNVAKPMGRENIIDGLRVAFRNLVAVFKSVHDAWVDVFPPTTSNQILKMTESFKNFMLSIRPSEATLDKLYRTFRGLFSVLDLGRQAISSLLKPVANVLGGFSDLSGGILDITASFGDSLYELSRSARAGNFFSALSDGLDSFVTKTKNAIKSVIISAGGIKGGLKTIADGVGSVFNGALDILGRVVTWIRENITAGDVFTGLAGSGAFIALKKFGELIDKLKNLFGGGEGGSLSEIAGNFSEVLGGVHESLESFSQGLKVASLLGIAAAVALLTSSLRKLSELKVEDIAVSLVAIRLMIASLNGGFNSLAKTLSKFNAKGAVRASIAMIAIAEAINILSDAMIKISSLDLAQIGKGLLGVGAAMGELVLAIKIMNGAKINLRTSVAILAIAKACQMLSTAVSSFSTMQWDEIGRGLAGMAGALGAVTAATAILSKAGGGGALLGSIGIFVTVQSLGELAESLKSFATMKWDEIKRGLSAMGGALAEIGIVLGALGKIAGFSSILASGAIWITVQSLSDMAAALKSFGSMSWEEIKRGLSAMGGALLEIGVVTGLLGKLAGFSGLFGAGTILIVIQGLNDMTLALQNFGSMSWDEIGRGLAAMGGALLEVALVSGGLGKLAGLSGLFGAGTIWLTVQSLGDLYTAMQGFSSLSWDEIGRGLVAMGGALLEVSAISGGLGALAGLAGLIGGASIWVTVQSLDDLANALKKFSEMSWDEIGRGLSAMGGAMMETAIGGLLNTFSGLGAASISTLAEPLGALADSVKKWQDVTVPEGLGTQLGSLAGGVSKFNFSGWGADAIAAVAIPIGDLADSISKWTGISIPETLGNQLSSLATGVSSFNFSGWGADAIAAVATPLGDLATSISKWQTVDVPDTMQADLQGLANGIEAFSFAFVGGWSISSLIEPLTNLADVVSLWNDVTMPEGLEDDLTGLANGCKAFSGILTGWSLGTVVEPLAELAESVSAWSGIDISGTASGIDTLAISLKNLGDVGVKGLVNSLDGAADSAISSITAMINGINTTIVTGKDTISASFSDLVSGGLTEINNKTSDFTTAAEAIIEGFNTGITVKKQTVLGSLRTMLNEMANIIKSGYSSFVSVGRYFVEGFAQGITVNTYKAKAAASAMSRAARLAAEQELKIESPSKVMEQDGEYFVEGFAQGVENETDSATEAARQFAEDAYGNVIEVIWDKEAFINDIREKANAKAVEQEEAHWQGLFDARNAAAEASKQQVVEMVDFEEEMLEKTNQILDNYTNEFNSKADSIMNSAGLFDEVTQRDEEDAVTKGSLTKNLQDQVNQYQHFTEIIADLNERLEDGGLKDYINDLSVSSIYELEALNSMTEDELNKYVELFDQKFELAKQAALIQTEGLATDTEDQLSELYGGIKVDLPEFTQTYDGSIQSIKQYMQQSFAKQNFEAAWNEFKETGGYVAEGFKSGIMGKAGEIAAAAVELARNAIDAVEEELEVASPSKVFFRIGRFTGEGFLRGLQNYADKSYNAGSAIAEKARAGLTATMGDIANALSSDMDTTPTIRPVVDMSDVTTKAKTISDMMNMNTSATVRANVGAISFGMNRLRQNGPNDDVISAIDKLRRDLGSVGGTTYNVNGVTYDDGSNVSEAVRSLIRAARIDRRV